MAIVEENNANAPWCNTYTPNPSSKRSVEATRRRLWFTQKIIKQQLRHHEALERGETEAIHCDPIVYCIIDSPWHCMSYPRHSFPYRDHHLYRLLGHDARNHDTRGHLVDLESELLSVLMKPESATSDRPAHLHILCLPARSTDLGAALRWLTTPMASECDGCTNQMRCARDQTCQQLQLEVGTVQFRYGSGEDDMGGLGTRTSDQIHLLEKVGTLTRGALVE